MAGNQTRRCNPTVLKLTLGLVALCIAGYIIGPPLYWHLMEGLVAISRSSSSSVSVSGSCPPCNCDCSSQPLLTIPEGLNNVSFADGIFDDATERDAQGYQTHFYNFQGYQMHRVLRNCAKPDPLMGENSETNFADLLSEELKLRETEAAENQKRADMALLEAKKLTSQYQKEADKCNSGMSTCEEARDKAERALSAQQKLTALWESRARQKGWKDGVAASRSKAQSQGKVQSV